METVGYIYWNPVRRGLVKHPGEWKWSSAIDYAGVDAVEEERRCGLVIDSARIGKRFGAAFPMRLRIPPPSFQLPLFDSVCLQNSPCGVFSCGASRRDLRYSFPLYEQE